ncbi:hypothetical protein [Mycobacterium asiaticum]|uniref:hypothetical protein n=1 Tax=Mycobacterium asiaticum TaxID=1790 RepID=UPI000A92AFDB|nr:hypothetical protein [Mycobacterium asiaticum]
MAKTFGRLTELNRGLIALRDNVGDLKDDYDRTINSIMGLTAVDGAEYMKDRARWRDDTGNRKDRVPGAARAGLNTSTDLKGTHKVIRFAHGVDYGIWLEIKNNGKWQIIMPAVAEMGKRLMKNLRGSLSQVRKNAGR